MAINTRNVDVTDWLDWEMPDMTLPYVVTGAPYGESLELAYATEFEAMTTARYINDLTGTYATSWGDQPVNTDVIVTRYYVSPASVLTRANETCERIEREYALPVRGEGETESNLADWELALMVGAQYAEPLPADSDVVGQTNDHITNALTLRIREWLIESSIRTAGSLYGMGPRLSRSTGASWGI